ncbi:cytochrome d ubiquinol oxidase subunit II [Bacteroides eggerthii]|uniref:Cytochrome d ubiquinol oxidase subunit II n=1 Tax=Bacteroides eggerthii TaxID=28111 RepID=A0ABT7U5M5_9BACE|nr:cytochrome d ubiquinol oxidase subunit II [Bacteroides eggerthii]
MMDYVFYQEYWWFLVSLLGGLLVFLLFVQGGNALIFSLGKNETERKMIVNSTGRKWEFTFTTLVTFGGAFFASFPLFYSTSFGGAYWLWMLILFSFVLQAVSYEYQSKKGNLLGRNTYRAFLVLNGIMGPFLLGCAVATFFTGSAFTVSKGQLLHEAMPVISSWGNSWHGLDALGNVWNVVLGLAVVFLSRVLGALYLINNISDQMIERRARRAVAVNTVFFLIFFLSFVIRLFLTEGFAVDPENGRIFMEPFKYWNNLLALPVVAVIFLLGVAGVLAGILAACFGSGYRKGIWWTGSGTVLAVLGLLLLAGYNHTAYYPSTLDLQSSLTLANSCSSEFTLKTMSVVSLLIPFVLAYIFYAWRCIDRKKIDANEMNDDDHTY